jgi:3'-5' exoribonuclease
MESVLLLKDLVDRARVRGVFLCTQKSLPVGRNGKPYLSLTLADRSASVDARVWDQADAVAQRFAEMDLVQVEGTAVLYQGRLQLHLTTVERAVDPALDVADFMPAASAPVDDMWEGLRQLVASVASLPLRGLLEEVLDDPGLAPAFRRCPAAKSIHHASVGGLLEHTLSVARLVDAICGHYAAAAPGLIDRDLALAGAILHDLGKVRELSSAQGFGYTDEGRLLGHIVLGDELVAARIQRHPDFPAELALRLRHVLVAHHGALEHGSPRRPKTMEAIVVHLADQLDCQAGFLRDLFAREGVQRWSSYQKIYDRYFFHAGGEVGEGGPGEE